jgi:hypothetical protein
LLGERLSGTVRIDRHGASISAGGRGWHLGEAEAEVVTFLSTTTTSTGTLWRGLIRNSGGRR